MLQALYGAGTISSVLKMDNFDSAVFLINYNFGFAMTIPELAEKFYVVDPTKEGDGNDKVATIHCNNTKGVPSRSGWLGDKPGLCNHPFYSINR